MKITQKMLCLVLGFGLSAIGSGAMADQPGHGARQNGGRQAHPQNGQNNTNAREHRQHDRIAQGVSSNQLTRDETRGLAGQQREIRQEEREYRSDGQFTKKERNDIRHDQNQASQDIYQEKHDAERRPAPGSFAPDKDGFKGAPGQHPMREKLENMPPEKRQAMRERFKNASPEERRNMKEKMRGNSEHADNRKKMRENFEAMPQEEREKMRAQMKGRGDQRREDQGGGDEQSRGNKDGDREERDRGNKSHGGDKPA